MGSSHRPWSPGLLTPLGPPAGDTLGTGGGLKAQVLGASSLVQLGTGGHPGQPDHSRDLTVTRLLGELVNLALTRPLPSTSSENLRESAQVSRDSGPGSWGQQLRQAPGGLGRRRGGTGVIEQAQLGQACGGRAGSQRPLGEAVTVPSSVSIVPRGCGRAEEGVALWAGLGLPCARLKRGCPTPAQPHLCPRRSCGCCLGFVQALVPALTLAQALHLRVRQGPGAPSRLTWAEAHSPHTPREGAAPLWVGATRHSPGLLPSQLHTLPHQLTEGPTSPVRLAVGLGLSWSQCLRASVFRAPRAGCWVRRQGSPACCPPPCSTSPSRQTVL